MSQLWTAHEKIKAKADTARVPVVYFGVNYIHQLQKEVEDLRNEVVRMREGLWLLYVYAQSPKFRGEDPTMQAGDVILRVREILAARSEE
jgi:hypothetical protein